MVLLFAFANLTLAQQPTVQERVLALKASIAASKAILKRYEWVETTVVSVKGEEKSRQMNSCYYGVDGKEQKIPLTAPPPEERRRGIRGRIAERKKEELTDYMKEAIALVKQYVPPDAANIQAAKDAGNVSLSPLSDQRVRLTFTDYIKSGDSLALVVDLANNRPLEAKVSTYLEKEKDAVTLDVTFSTLPDNATYPSTIALEAKAKDLTVSVQNSGYRLQTQ
jgi:hypothetical protein